MRRWIDLREGSLRGEVPEVDAFLAEIEEVCRRHGMSIAHEDERGEFRIQRFDEQSIERLKQASDNRGRD